MQTHARFENGNVSGGTHYIVSGELVPTKTVCCVHGIGGDSFVFDHIAKSLSSAGYGVVQYDLIGRGRSLPHPTGRYDADAHINQLLQLLTETLTISEPVHLIGHSMGGALAALFTAKHPDKVRSLTLLSPAGLMNSGPLPLLRSSSCLASMIRRSINNPKGQEKAWRSGFHKKRDVYGQRAEEMVAYMKANTSPQSFEAFWQSALQFPLYGIQAQAAALAQQEHLQVCLIFAGRDTMVPTNPNYKRWVSVLQSGRLRRFTHSLMEDTGHTFPLEMPDETNALVLDFLNSTL